MRIWRGLGFCLALGGCIPPGTSLPRQTTVAAPVSQQPDAEFFSNDQPVQDVQQVRAVSANAISVSAGRYTVQPGDTLIAIGNRTGAGLETLARANNLTAPYVLHPGDVLTVPAGRYHDVAAGQTGIAIARAYGVPWRSIVEANGLVEPYNLRAGQKLRIPGDAVSLTAPSMEERAAAFRIDIDDVVSGSEPARQAGDTVQPSLPGVSSPAHLDGGFTWPAAGAIAARFGPASGGRVNQGIEMSVGAGSSILAAAGGTVAFVGSDVAPVGGLVLIKHGDGWITVYGHVATFNVVRGQNVARGQVLGNAGRGAAPLLFFQTRRNGKPVNPMLYLPPR